MARPKVCRAVTVQSYSDNIFESAKLEETPLPELTTNQVLCKFIAAPINPSDMMTIAGRYGTPGGNTTVKACPVRIGYEGVAEIAEVGKDVKSVALGDWVIPVKSGLGTWRDYGICEQQEVFKIDKRVGYQAAATLLINPATAYFLLTENKLEPGQTLIQNGANSMVGKCLIQVAKSMGYKTINVVRNRANIQELVKELEDLGADKVVTDDKLKDAVFEEKPVLAIDCVAGEAGAMLFRHLANGGTFVNYGAMSGQGIPVSPVDMIFKDFTMKGYHQSNSIAKNPKKLTDEAFPYLGKLTSEGKFKSPNYELFSLDNFKKGMEQAAAGFSNKKQLIVMDEKLM